MAVKRYTSRNNATAAAIYIMDLSLDFFATFEEQIA
jgi:hypothetical protein